MKIYSKIKTLVNRRNLANCLMFLFVIGISVGCGLIFVPAGFIAGGISCGIFGYLLGSE